MAEARLHIEPIPAEYDPALLKTISRKIRMRLPFESLPPHMRGKSDLFQMEYNFGDEQVVLQLYETEDDRGRPTGDTECCISHTQTIIEENPETGSTHIYTPTREYYINFATLEVSQGYKDNIDPAEPYVRNNLNTDHLVELETLLRELPVLRVIEGD